MSCSLRPASLCRTRAPIPGDMLRHWTFWYMFSRSSEAHTAVYRTPDQQYWDVWSSSRNCLARCRYWRHCRTWRGIGSEAHGWEYQGPATTGLMSYSMPGTVITPISDHTTDMWILVTTYHCLRLGPALGSKAHIYGSAFADCQISRAVPFEHTYA